MLLYCLKSVPRTGNELAGDDVENCENSPLGTCQKLAGEEGGWKQRGGHNLLSLRKERGHEKWAVKRGRVMQIYARDHVEVHPQKKKEVLYLAKKKRKIQRFTERYGYKL